MYKTTELKLYQEDFLHTKIFYRKLISYKNNKHSLTKYPFVDDTMLNIL